MRNLLIVGAGGFAREAYCWIHPEAYQVIGFYSEMDGPTDIFGFQVLRSLDFLPMNTDFLVAIGDPKTRERLFSKLTLRGLLPCKPLLCPIVIFGRDISIGDGSIICPGSILSTNIKLGVGSIVNLNCTIGHDSVLEDFVTLSPGANISGNVRLGERSYIGTNAAIREKITLGKDCTLGMGAALTRNMPSGEMWVGVPAMQMRPKME